MNKFEQMEYVIQRKILLVRSAISTYRDPHTSDDEKYFLKSDCQIEMDYYAWPGGYPLYYLTKDGGCLCPKCANENIDLLSDPDDPQWYLIGCEINYEDQSMYCDNCNERIESAYGDDIE